ncbi:MAG: DUF4468 domain-containing protein [Cytophagaceae bacterium]
MRLLLLTGLLFITSLGFSQSALKLKDGRYIATECIRNNPTANTESFFNSLEAWLRQNFKETEKSILINKAEKFAIAEGYYLIINKGLVSRDIPGAIQYKLKIELIDNSYIYIFHDFVFQVFEKNENGQYLPTKRFSNIETLESLVGKEKASDLMADLEKRIKSLANSLKSDLAKL